MLNGEKQVIGNYTPMGPVSYSDDQRKVFEFQNYQNFLKAIYTHPRQYFQLPHQKFFGVGGRKNTDNEYHQQQQMYLELLLQTIITDKNVTFFESDLKKFIKDFVLDKNRLYRALKEGFSGHKDRLYTGCVIRTDNDDKFGTYDTQLVRGNIEYFSPTINMSKIIKEVEEEVAKEVRAKYRGGSRRSKKNRNRKTRRR
jgi:hypothetical protein